MAEKRPGIIDLFVSGARRGFNISMTGMLPNVVMAFVITRLLHHPRVKTIRAVATTDIFLLSEQKALLCYFIPLRNLLKTSCFG